MVAPPEASEHFLSTSGLPASAFSGVSSECPLSARYSRVLTGGLNGVLGGACCFQVASEIEAADAEVDEQSAPVSNWDFVAPTAVIEEYMENMYHCVSAI